MECKEVICDILKVFFDLRTNIRITAFMQEFRKEFEHMIQLTENSQNINSNMKNDENQIQMLSAFLKKSTGFLKKIGIQEEENLKKNNIDVFQYIENPLSWVNSLLQRKSIEIVEAAPVNLTALLLDLTLYDHPELVNKAFELLYKLNSESRSVLEAVREIQLLENQDQVKAFVEIKVQKEKLQELADASEIWYELKDQSSINQHQNTVHILQELIKLLELKFDEIDPRESLKEPENDEIPASKEEKLLLNTENPNEASLILNYSVNKDRQELMRNLNIAEPVINLIKYDVKVSEDEHPSKLILIKLCYKFLAGFCHGNLKNQNLIEVEFDNFLQHMLKTPNSDAQLLIIELFYNNKRLLFNSEKIDRVFETFCLVLEKSETLSLKEYLMNSLQTFLKYKSAAIKINQTKLVTAMGSNNYKKILNSIESDDQLLEEFIKRITKFQDQIDQKLKENSSNIIDLPADIGYFSQQLLILSLVSEEKNYAAESRCQYFFPLEVLKKLLENTKNMWYIRKYLVFFLYNVYFETEKEMNETQNVINHLIKLIVEDFEILASEIDDSKLLSLRTFRGKTSIYNTQLDYLNLSLLPCLNLIFKMNLISSANIMDIYKRSIEALIVLGNKNLQNNLIRANLSNFLTVLLKKRTIINNLNYNEKYKNSIPSNLLKEKKIAMALKKSYTHMENTHQNMEISSKSDKFRKRLDQTIKSRTYLTKVEHEFESLVENIVNIELLTQKTFFNLCNIGYQELCTSLLKLIDPTDMTLSMDLTIVGLTVFRKIIERENTDKQTCSADWTSNDFQAYSKKIEIRQNELCNFGLVEVIGNMIGNESLSRQLKNEAILVGISMLMGGNSKVQDRFFKYLEGEDSKNLLLVNLKEMLEDDFQKIKKVMDAKNKGYLEKILEIQAEIAEKKEKTMIINPENSSALTKEKARTSKKKKTFNEEEQELLEKEEEEKRTLSSKTKEIESNEEEEDESERTEIQEKIQNCTRIFRLLQLFCEGHKSEMQNHLRVQIQHKIIHAKTQNFITDSSYKFGSLIKFVNINCTCLLNQIIDFLIEAIQGPCVQNQMELSKAKIVEFVKDLLSTFIRPNDYLKRGFLDSDEQGNINSIVTKSSNLLIALIEGNTTDEILKDLCTRLDFRFMRQVLAKEYEAFLTNNLGLNRPFPDVEDVNSLMKFDKYEGNIAEAFNLFLLIKTIAINLASKDRESKNSAQYALESDPEDNPLANQALEFFDSNVLSIEIMFHEKLHRIFFPIEPVCRNLSRETRRILMAEVKRDSPNEKISGLLAASSALFNEMEHMTYLKTWRLSFTAARLSFFRDLSTLLAFFLNILMLATFYREIQTDTGQQDFSKVHSVIREGGIENTPDGNNINILLWVFGVIQVCTSGLMLLFWIILYSKLVIKTKWGELVQENKQTMLNNNYEEELEEDDAFEMENIDNQFAQYLLYTKGPDSKFFRKDGKRNFGTNFLKFHYYIKSMVMLLSAPGLLYSVFYIVVSLFGLLLSPLFYCYHLLDIVSRFETLKNVIRSVTRNANQLLLTLFLGLVILYMFTILMFFFLFDAYYDESINSDESLGQNTCSTMFQCYLTTVNYVIF